jgi:hypothetical protein
MAILAKIRTAGMTAVIATSVVGFAAATEASECGTCDGPAIILNEQLFDGGRIFQGTLDVVVDEAPEAAVSTGAIGNTYAAITNGRAIDANSTQRLDGNGASRTSLQAGYAASGAVLASTFGNGLKLESGDADISAHAQQISSGNVTSDALVNGGSISNLTANAASVANAISAETGNGEIVGDFYQRQNGTTRATSLVNVGRLGGNALIGTEAAANTVTTTALYSGGALLTVNQSAHGDMVLADSQASTGYADQITAHSSATGNSVSSEHFSGYAQLSGRQENASYIKSNSELEIDELEWDANVAALAQGNTASISTTQSDGHIYLDQLNMGGGVEANGSLTVNRGVMMADANQGLSVQAYGNALTGQTCSDCRVTMSGFSSQTNGANVVATGRVNTVGGNVYGSVVAVGNSATYQSVSPH